jgi:hypothetical protein
MVLPIEHLRMIVNGTKDPVGGGGSEVRGEGARWGQSGEPKRRGYRSREGHSIGKPV